MAGGDTGHQDRALSCFLEFPAEYFPPIALDILGHQEREAKFFLEFFGLEYRYSSTILTLDIHVPYRYYSRMPSFLLHTAEPGNTIGGILCLLGGLGAFYRALRCRQEGDRVSARLYVGLGALACVLAVL